MSWLNLLLVCSNYVRIIVQGCVVIGQKKKKFMYYIIKVEFKSRGYVK